MKRPTLLVTAFGPFGERGINQSSGILGMLERSISLRNAFDVSFLTLPVLMDFPRRAVAEAFTMSAIDYVVSLGEAERQFLSLEKTAVNIRDYRIPDNAGNQPAGTPIADDGPETYAATLPYDSFLRAASQSGVEVSTSRDAGRFLCNEMLYATLHTIAVRKLETVAGFIHVPADNGDTRGLAATIEEGLLHLAVYREV